MLGTRSRGEKAPEPSGGFEMIPLPYDYAALEPYIDAQTMQLHYDKHYGAYTKNLNEALKDYPALRKLKIEELLSRIDALPEAVRKAVRNNGGGYYNHGLFWQMMKPQGGSPQGALSGAIKTAFGGFEEMKKAFSAKAAAVFGSGWAWLVVRDGRLEITSTPNQDSPIMKGIAEVEAKPVLGLDVWEHAYYLKYKNERAKYIASWWNVANWDTAKKLYEEAMG
ncbi:MAG: superoxide dismutase [Chthoniobacteraceae bacterium]